MQSTEERIQAWGEAHRERLTAAQNAIRHRTHYSPFIESPARRHHAPNARQDGATAYEAHLNKEFVLQGPQADTRVGNETSPYTQHALGITYAAPTAEALVTASDACRAPLAAMKPHERVNVCLEILERWNQKAFEQTCATMHTTGQPFMLAFAGSGASSLERGLEAVCHAADAMAAIPSAAMFERTFGSENVSLFKRFQLRPRGVGVVISCGSYPNWNAFPAILANLATGNPTIVKPSPRTILPVAIAVREAQDVLVEAGLPSHAILLAPDTLDAPITKSLVEHPLTKMIDYTGGQEFGNWLERRQGHGQLVYTETSGCNAVIVDSVFDLDATLDAIAHGFTFFSGQMCTAPQNLYVATGGVEVKSDGSVVEAKAFIALLAERIDAIAADPKHAAAVFGAIQNAAVAAEMAALTASIEEEGGTIVRRGGTYDHLEFPQTQTLTPAVLQVPKGHAALEREHFGPVVLATVVEDRAEALAHVTANLRTAGSIANYVYTTSDTFSLEVEDAFADAGASVGINLVRQLPIHFSAAFSDFHVTGLNPAGNACLADAAFVANRFRIVQSKTEVIPPTAWQKDASVVQADS